MRISDISPNSQDKLWAHFQNKCPETFEGARPRINYIIREIARKKKTSVPRVLNIGAGNGYMEDTAKQLGWDICSLDPDERTIKRILEKDIKGHIGHIEKMPFDNSSFDFVVASEVLEHLDKKQFYMGISEVVRVIDQCGWFIGTVPYRENLVLNQVICPRCGQVFHRWGHRRSFDLKTMRESLSISFSDVVVRRRAFVKFKGLGLGGKIKGLVRLILAGYGVAIAEPSIFFIAMK